MRRFKTKQYLPTNQSPTVWLALFVVILALTRCTTAPVEKYQRYNLTGYTQGTTFSIIYVDSTDRSAIIKRKVDSILTAIDNSLSTYNPNSIVSKLNKSDSCLLIDNHILSLFLTSNDVNMATDGAFDPTVKPLVNLFGFGAHPYNFDEIFADSTLTSETKDSLIRAYRDSASYDLADFVGFEYLMLNGDIIYNSFEDMLNGDLHDNFVCKEDSIVEITFDAIAQGYTSDVIGDFLNFQMGIGDYLVEVGGEIVAQGYRIDNKPWLVQIEHPNTTDLAGEDEVARVQMDTNFRAIAVSGNYRKVNNRKEAGIVHSIDPRTGQPATNNILSATVITDEAAIADAYATAFMVMRLEEIIPIVEKGDLNLYVVIIYNDEQGEAQTYISTNLEDHLLYPVKTVSD